MNYENLIEDLGNVALGVLSILYGDSDFTPQQKAPMTPFALSVIKFRDELLSRQGD